MDIKGLDYNTGRDKLLMPEYGREIQKMVDFAIDLPTKKERMDFFAPLPQYFTDVLDRLRAE